MDSAGYQLLKQVGLELAVGEIGGSFLDFSFGYKRNERITKDNVAVQTLLLVSQVLANAVLTKQFVQYQVRTGAPIRLDNATAGGGVAWYIGLFSSQTNMFNRSAALAGFLQNQITQLAGAFNNADLDSWLHAHSGGAAAGAGGAGAGVGAGAATQE